MPNLSSHSLIVEKVKRTQADLHLDDLPEAFSTFCLQLILGLNEVEVEDAVTDDPADGGIDAVYRNDRDVHVFSFKFTEAFEQTHKNFPENDVNQLTLTMTQLIQKTLARGAVNPLVWEAAQDIWTAFESLGHLDFHFHLVTNKQKPVPAAIQRFEQEMRAFHFVDFSYIDQETLANKIIDDKFRRVDGSLRFVDKQYFEHSDGDLRGVVATVPAEDLIRLITRRDDPSQIDEDCFADNVRLYQRGSSINQRIKESALTASNYQFWYLNNGITIVCEECIYPPKTHGPLVELRNFQIVNGGQTSHALFEAWNQDRDRLAEVTLLVRICVTKRDNVLADRISETTNSQTPVTTRDLHANDHVQKKLQEEFLALGYYYERKNGEFPEVPAMKRLNNEVLGQLSLAYYLGRPSEAKNSKALVFGSSYTDIFDENRVTARMFLPPLQFLPRLLELKREIQRKKRRRQPIDETEAFVSRAVFHILYACALLCPRDNLNPDDARDRDKAVQLSIGVLRGLTEAARAQRGAVYTHDKFFKETATNQLIRDAIVGGSAAVV